MAKRAKKGNNWLLALGGLVAAYYILWPKGKTTPPVGPNYNDPTPQTNDGAGVGNIRQL